MIRRNDPQAALSMIDTAERNLGSEELFVTEKILANRQLKADSQLPVLLRKCQQSPSRKQSCQKLMPGAA